MRKAPTQNYSFAGFAWRLVAAASLAATLTAVACTTDRTPGAGEPERFMPAVAPGTPSSTQTPGSEMNNVINPPMASAYTPSPGVAVSRGTNVDALAILAADQGFRGRVLGPAFPEGPVGLSMAQGDTGQFINPSLTTNPELTVNSSISSTPVPVITSGAGEGVASALVGGQVIAASPATSALTTTTIPNVRNSIAGSVAGVTGTGTTTVNTSLLTPTMSSAATISPTLAANTGANGNVSVSTTLSTAAPVAAGAPLIDNAGGLLTPTMSSAATIGPTLAANPGLGARPTLIATTPTTTTTTAAATNSVVVTRSATGTLMITNIGTAGARTQAVRTTPATGSQLIFTSPVLPAQPRH